mgnify:FL=1
MSRAAYPTEEAPERADVAAPRLARGLWGRKGVRTYARVNAPVQGPAVTAHPLGGIVVEIPGLRLVSELNQHEHFRVRAKRAQDHHAIVGSTLRVMGGAVVPLPCRVAVTRVAARALDVGDNLQSSAKHVRDAVAEWLGIDDRDARVEWSVAQERGPYGVRVEIVPVRPFGGITTARVVPEGIVTRVECVLGPKATGVLAEALADLARGERQQVTLHVGAVRLVVRAPEKE